MSWLFRTLRSSIGKKVIMGLTGLSLWFYLIVHLAGNLAFFCGSDAFNGYAHFLESLPIIRPVEAGLVLVFLIHIILGIVLTLDNRAAKAGGYAVGGSKKDNTLTARTMIWSGLIILVFLFIHVNQFRLGHPPPDAHGYKDYYGVEVQVFSNALYSVWYLIAVMVLAFHIGHGFQSAFRSLGLSHPQYNALVEWVSRGAAVLFAIAFGALPLWVLLGKVA